MLNSYLYGFICFIVFNDIFGIQTVVKILFSFFYSFT